MFGIYFVLGSGRLCLINFVISCTSHSQYGKGDKRIFINTKSSVIVPESGKRQILKGI